MDTKLEKLSEDAAAALSDGNLEKANELYQQLLEKEPGSSDAMYALGTIAFQNKDYPKALALFDKAANSEPEAVDIAFNYASCLAAAGDRLGALMQLQRATKYCRDDSFFVPRIADLSIRLGEPAAAITLMSRLTRLTPDNQIILANAQGMLGNWREAVNGLKFLHQSLPDDSVVAEKLAVAAGKLHDFNTAIFAFENYLRLVTPTAKDYLKFADLLLLAQEADRCEKAIKLSQELGEDSAELFMLIARTERLNGNDNAVIEALDQVLVRQPKNGQAWAIKVELAKSNQLDNFIDLLVNELADGEALVSVSNWHQSLLHYALASLYDRIGEFEKAAGVLKTANGLQYDELQMSDSFYNAELTQAQTQQTMMEFGADLFEQKDRVLEDEETQISPIFIVGMPRSGTTLVERIIGQNKRVFCAGELEAMEFVAADYKHRSRHNRIGKPCDLTESEWAQLRTLYLEKLPEISEPIFTDKLPHNFRNVGLILKMFPDAKIVQMHRAAKDVCLSIYQKAFAPGHNYANRWEDLRHFNMQAERLMRHWSSIESPRLLDLQYEDLVREPERYAGKLIEFLGFEWDNSYLDFHKSMNKSFTFSELQVREPISEKRIGGWQNYAAVIPELGASWEI